MSFDLLNFTTSPNFHFKEVISSTSDCLSSTYQFDCYKNKNGETILIAPFFDISNLLNQKHHISLINLKNNQIIKELDGIEDRIVSVHYFKDPVKENDYLISADRRYNIIIWDFSNNYEKIYQKQIKYEGYIYACLLFFDKEKMYAAVSSIGEKNVTKVIDVYDSIEKNKNKNKDDKTDVDNITDIQNSKDLNIYFITHWYNEKEFSERKKNVIIQCGKKKILFTEYPNNTTYHEIQTEEKYQYNLSGIVFKNNDKDLFAVASSFGLVQILDLETKNIIKSIKFKNVHLYSFVRWNDHYLLLNDCFQRKIIVFDMLNDYKIISQVLCPEMYFDRFIKKVVHPLYGESILSVGTDWKIKLFVNRNIIKPKRNLNK